MRIQNTKENNYVHWYSIADLTHNFRDASRNPPCGASPGGERHQRKVGRRKVAGMVHRFHIKSDLVIISFPYSAEN